MATTTDVIVIGAGQAGLAMSRCLRTRGLGHVVLEKGRVGQRWRHERWDSFTLLSPNWQTRLPGRRYTGDDPDGFMTGREVADMLAGYAAETGAEVREGVTVHAVETAVLNAVVAEDLPGPGSVFLQLDLRFLAPVRPGDVITGSVEVTSVRSDKPLTGLDVRVTRDDEVVAVEGTAVCWTARPGG